MEVVGKVAWAAECLKGCRPLLKPGQHVAWKQEAERHLHAGHSRHLFSDLRHHAGRVMDGGGPCLSCAVVLASVYIAGSEHGNFIRRGMCWDDCEADGCSGRKRFEIRWVKSTGHWSKQTSGTSLVRCSPNPVDSGVCPAYKRSSEVPCVVRWTSRMPCRSMGSRRVVGCCQGCYCRGQLPGWPAGPSSRYHRAPDEGRLALEQQLAGQMRQGSCTT